MSRRSKSIALVAALSSSAFMLSACSEPPPPKDVTAGDAANADALKTCIANPSNTVDKCEQYFGPNAKQVSYTAQNSCEAQYGAGQCQPQRASDGSSVYVPLMLGYMLGNMNSGGGGVRHVYHYNPPPPTYYQSRSTYYGSSPRTSFKSSPSYTSSHYSSPSYSSSVRSGGFGGSAAAHGGCCS